MACLIKFCGHEPQQAEHDGQLGDLPHVQTIRGSPQSRLSAQIRAVRKARQICVQRVPSRHLANFGDVTEANGLAGGRYFAVGR